jgi:Phage holin T7 family, holin superfamily II
MKDSVSAPSEVTTAVTKVAAVWAGTLFGIQLSDIVLLATLLYTLLQICLLVSEKIIKPWLREYKNMPGHLPKPTTPGDLDS